MLPCRCLRMSWLANYSEIEKGNYGIIFCSKSKELDFKEPLIVIDFLLFIRSLQQHVEVQGENERKDCVLEAL